MNNYEMKSNDDKLYTWVCIKCGEIMADVNVEIFHCMYCGSNYIKRIAENLGHLKEDKDDCEVPKG
jgi:predicted  nucleic acid-binding Zn-ribbon protein